MARPERTGMLFQIIGTIISVFLIISGYHTENRTVVIIGCTFLLVTAVGGCEDQLKAIRKSLEGDR